MCCCQCAASKCMTAQQQRLRAHWALHAAPLQLELLHRDSLLGCLRLLLLGGMGSGRPLRSESGSQSVCETGQHACRQCRCIPRPWASARGDQQVARTGLTCWQAQTVFSAFCRVPGRTAGLTCRRTPSWLTLSACPPSEAPQSTVCAGRPHSSASLVRPGPKCRQHQTEGPVGPFLEHWLARPNWPVQAQACQAASESQVTQCHSKSSRQA